MATWMQTVGTTLFAAKLSSTVRLRMIAHERRGTHGLLYPAAVWNDASNRQRPRQPGTSASTEWDPRLYRNSPSGRSMKVPGPLLARREINLAV